MDLYVAITDDVLDDIESKVAAYEPERGGALLGPVGMPVVSRFVLDRAASTSGSTFRPSRELQAAVSKLEQSDQAVELKGMLHSHPGSMNYPSSGDRHAFADSLRGAPWLGRFIVPIVTCGRYSCDNHEIEVPSGKVSVFVTEPVSADGRVDVKPARVHVLPVSRDTAALAKMVGGMTLARGAVDVDGATYITSGVSVHGLDLQLLVPSNYPTQAPLVLAMASRELSRSGRQLLERLGGDPDLDGVAALPLLWDLSVPEVDRLREGFRGAVTAAATAAPAAAAQPTAAAAQPAAAAAHSVDAARLGIRERLDGAESSTLADRSVLIAGAGSGGSVTADALARSGVERFVLVDADTVGPENVSRSVYRMRDVGVSKVAALKEHLQEINPLVTCEIIEQKIQDVPREQLNELIGAADLVVAATDDPEAQRTLNHVAYARGVPAVFGGLYARAQAGEVVFTVPGLTRCYQCTTTRHQDESLSPRMNYGVGRMYGEPALGADIQHVVTASVKLAIGLLQLDDESTDSSSRALVIEALTSRRNFLMLATVPRFGFFKDIFASTAGQLGYQSVWLGAQGDDRCVVCGTEPVDPLLVKAVRPKLQALRPRDGESPAEQEVNAQR